MRTIFSSWGEGFDGSGGLIMPAMLRAVCTGVNNKPQGNPHQPRTRLKAVPASWLFTPQLRHETCGVLLHRVTTSADNTLWLTCTSTGPEPLHLGHAP